MVLSLTVLVMLVKSASVRLTHARDGPSGPSGPSVLPSAEAVPPPLIDTALTAHRVSADALVSQACQPSVTPRPARRGLIGASLVLVLFLVVVESPLNQDSAPAVFLE